MQIATAIPNDQRVVLFARLSERLDDEHRRAKYDEPLAELIRHAGIEAPIRGFSQAGDDGEVAWTCIEVKLRASECASVVQFLIEVGAPPDTRVELETEKATVDFSLAEAVGRSSGNQ